MKSNSNAPVQQLLEWYDVHARKLPWRTSSKQEPAAYQVWVSEIMLQQTTVATVKDYFQRFMKKWPTVNNLANAELDEILRMWSGLGYYARARNMHKCAEVIAKDFQGNFPKTPQELQKLPGIGPYTAAAIAAIAFDHPIVPLDGNIERVTARVCNNHTPLPKAKKVLQEQAQIFKSEQRSGDVAQALMDLGADICTPKSPKCLLCPLSDICVAKKEGTAENLPRKEPKKAKPKRRAVSFWIRAFDGSILVRKRPEKGLLGGTIEIPTTPFGMQLTEVNPLESAPINLKWQTLPQTVKHVFTHFELTIDIYVMAGSDNRLDPKQHNFSDDHFWVIQNEFQDLALSTLMRKVAKVAIAGGY